MKSMMKLFLLASLSLSVQVAAEIRGAVHSSFSASENNILGIETEESSSIQHRGLMEDNGGGNNPGLPIIEPVECLPYENVNDSILNHPSSNPGCPTCANGCCRIFSWLLCDDQNAYTTLQCVCNENTATRRPTPFPTPRPTAAPTITPSPTKVPSASPSRAPSEPSAQPSDTPSASPSSAPSSLPSSSPTITPYTTDKTLDENGFPVQISECLEAPPLLNFVRRDNLNYLYEVYVSTSIEDPQDVVETQLYDPIHESLLKEFMTCKYEEEEDLYILQTKEPGVESEIFCETLSPTPRPTPSPTRAPSASPSAAPSPAPSVTPTAFCTDVVGTFFVNEKERDCLNWAAKKPEDRCDRMTDEPDAMEVWRKCPESCDAICTIPNATVVPLPEVNITDPFDEANPPQRRVQSFMGDDLNPKNCYVVDGMDCQGDPIPGQTCFVVASAIDIWVYFNPAVPGNETRKLDEDEREQSKFIEMMEQFLFIQMASGAYNGGDVLGMAYRETVETLPPASPPNAAPTPQGGSDDDTGGGDDDQDRGGDDGENTGPIVGIAVGAAIGGILLILLLVMVITKSRKKKQDEAYFKSQDRMIVEQAMTEDDAASMPGSPPKSRPLTAMDELDQIVDESASRGRRYQSSDTVQL